MAATVWGPRRILLPLAGLLAALIAAFGAWRLWPDDTWSRQHPAIAVLPFVNLGGDQATERLADGTTEDIITDLSRFADLDVIARTTTSPYKGEHSDVRQIGKNLGVNYVLTGSIQRQGDHLRVSAQLVDVTSGAHLWSNRWDRTAEDVFAVQAEVAEKVASSLGGYNALTQAGQMEAKRKRPGDLTAYDLYLIATDIQTRRAGVQDVERAKRLFDQAIANDRVLARAYVGRAWARLLLTLYGPPYDFVEGIAGMEADARAAIEQDPQEAEAHIVLGEALYNQGKFGESAAEYEIALHINPSSADILAYAAGILCFMGQAERAARLADRAVSLNPTYLHFYSYYLGPAYYFANRAADAVRVLEQLPTAQRYEFGWVLLAASYAMLEDESQAQAAREATLAINPEFSAEVGMTTNWRITGQRERQLFVEGIRRAGLPVCGSEAATARLRPEDRLPECSTERGKGSNSKT